MRHDTAIDYRRRIEGVLRHIQLHLDEPMTPEELAGLAHISKYHFHRVFSGMVGESVGEHVRRLRLERAAGALRRTDDSVIQIALASGYNAHEPFTRAFKAHFGMTPSEHREGNGALVFPEAPNRIHYGPDDAVSRFVPLMRENPMEKIERRTLEPMRLLAARHEGSYRGIGAAFGRLFGWAGPRGLVGPFVKTIGVYYDDPRAVEESSLRSDACIGLGPNVKVEPTDGLRIIETPGGECAVATYRGPYERIDEAYEWLFGTWLPESGLAVRDEPVMEIYLNNPQTTKPADLLTEICAPVATED
ncbi:MAG: AraC family transcriptional regulator [Planctomycetota bacterium]|nr:AraC family transcriptional regulator [Planctomycetota bacterium]